jgi:hypothetical protein
MSNKADRDLRCAAIEVKWGKATERRLFDNPGISVEVLKWDKGRNPRGVTLYVSVGTPLPAPGDGHVEEYMLGLDPDAFNAGWVLAALAGLRAQGRGRVGNGSVISFDEPLWSGTKMDSVLVMSSHNERDHNIAIGDGRHLSLLTVLPIYDGEHKVVKKYGADALLERWQQIDVEYWDPNRPKSRLK